MRIRRIGERLLRRFTQCCCRFQNGGPIHPVFKRCDLSRAENGEDARIGPFMRVSRLTMRALRDEELEKEVEAAQAAVSLGHALAERVQVEGETAACRKPT